jgi:glycosyltransferase involved in cell wall biosynthesis
LLYADVLIHPSFEETFGMSVVEAMAAAKPVVSTRVGGGLVEDSRSGFLIEPDDVGGLAHKVVTLLLDSELRRRFGDRGREIVIQQFDPRQVAEQHVAVYEEVMGRQTRS